MSSRIGLEKEPLAFIVDEKRVFDQLYQIPELDHFLDIGKQYFVKKYNVDYFSMHMMNSGHNFLISRFGHDEWHEWHRHNNLFVHKNYVVVNKLHSMSEESIYFDYFDSMMVERDVKYKTNVSDIISQERAAIIGERKYGGCQIKISNNLNDKIIYDITFKNDDAFGTLSKSILTELIKDLIRYRDLLLPFVRHGEVHGDFNDKRLLHQSISDFKQKRSDLFCF
jgi:hypothetical protein